MRIQTCIFTNTRARASSYRTIHINNNKKMNRSIFSRKRITNQDQSAATKKKKPKWNKLNENRAKKEKRVEEKTSNWQKYSSAYWFAAMKIMMWVAYDFSLMLLRFESKSKDEWTEEKKRRRRKKAKEKTNDQNFDQHYMKQMSG